MLDQKFVATSGMFAAVKPPIGMAAGRSRLYLVRRRQSSNVVGGRCGDRDIGVSYADAFEGQQIRN